MPSKVYCYLAHTLFLFADDVSWKYTEQIVKWHHHIFFLLFLFGFFCFRIFHSFFCFLFLRACVFLFETKNIYSDTHSTMGQVNDKKIFHPAYFQEQVNCFLAQLTWITKKIFYQLKERKVLNKLSTVQATYRLSSFPSECLKIHFPVCWKFVWAMPIKLPLDTSIVITLTTEIQSCQQ